MIKKLKLVLHVVWAIAAVVLGVTIGAVYGWTHHGLAGAIALGFVGLCVGAFIAASPLGILEILS